MVMYECKSCRWRGSFPGVDWITCDFAFITGHCRTAMEPREDRLCPAFEDGEPVRVEVRPMDKPFRTIVIKGRPFTHAEILELYNKGMSDGEIAREIGSVKSTIYQWRHRNGLKANAKKQDANPRYDYGKFRELYDSGMSDSKIARAIGCAMSTVSRWRTLEGLESHGVSGTAPKLDRAKMRELYDIGLSDAKIAREVGCHPSTVGKWRLRENLPAHGG